MEESEEEEEEEEGEVVEEGEEVGVGRGAGGEKEELSGQGVYCSAFRNPLFIHAVVLPVSP